jgi:hypothetical protein
MAKFAGAGRHQSQVEEKRNLGACGASQEREGEMDRDGQAPRPASDIKHGKMAVVGLAGHIWPISNTPVSFVTLCPLGSSPVLGKENAQEKETRIMEPWRVPRLGKF